MFLKIGQTVFASRSLSPNLPCFCANCVQSEAVLSNIDSSCGLPGFLHGAVNLFQIIVEDNSLCLNRIELYFNYSVGMYSNCFPHKSLHNLIFQRYLLTLFSCPVCWGHRTYLRALRRLHTDHGYRIHPSSWPGPERHRVRLQLHHGYVNERMV